MVTLLTCMQEVRGLNPGAAHQSLEPTSPTLPPGRKDVSRVPERDGVRESRAPGMTTKKGFVAVFLTTVVPKHLSFPPRLEGNGLAGGVGETDHRAGRLAGNGSRLERIPAYCFPQMFELFKHVFSLYLFL